MRMRHKKNCASRIEACAEIVIANPKEMCGKWKTLAGERKLAVEIGCGKGAFITETARCNPDTFFVGFEKISDVIVLAMEKVKAAELKNVVFIIDDAENLLDIFAENELDEVYLNFSDPWPKKKHIKRRLTYIAFLERYKRILHDEGKIYFKTDNRPLFDFSLEEFEKAHIALSDVTFDLHHSEFEAANVHTEYEDNFSAKGFSINRLVGTVDKHTVFAPAAPAAPETETSDEA